MDIDLHGEMDGIEAARRIRAELGIRSVILTAYAEEETMARARVADPLGYLLKPFELTELHTCLRAALARQAADASDESGACKSD